MATQFRDPGSPPRSSGGEPSLLLDGYVTVDQSNRSEALRSIRGKSTMATLAVTALLSSAPGLAVAQSLQTDGSAAARAGAIAHTQKMRRLFPDTGGDIQATPPVIPQLEIDSDPSGAVATFQPSGPMETAKNAFFQSRNEWTHLLHLPSARGRMVNQCATRAGPV